MANKRTSPRIHFSQRPLPRVGGAVRPFARLQKRIVYASIALLCLNALSYTTFMGLTIARAGEVRSLEYEMRVERSRVAELETKMRDHKERVTLDRAEVLGLTNKSSRVFVTGSAVVAQQYANER